MTTDATLAALRLSDQLGPTLVRKLIGVAVRIRTRETLFRDDEIVGEAAFALKEAIEEAATEKMWADRGRWLLEKMSERTTPDGRTVLEISEEPIWAKADGTFADYCSAVDAAMERDLGPNVF